jgi:AraC-like DNA-binding protein
MLVTLPRRPPPDRKPYDDFFKTKIVFASEAASVSFAPRWLRRRLPTANASLRAFLQRLVQRASRRRGSEVDEMRRVIRLQLINGKPGIDRAAAMLGAHRRTLTRRLAAQGATFRALVQDVRFEMADELMKETNASMGRIAELLGYSDQTAFSRAFSNRFGHPPSRARGEAP